MLRVLHIIHSASGGGAEKLLEDWLVLTQNYNMDVLTLTTLPSSFASNSSYFSTGASHPYNIRNFFRVFKFIKNYDIIHAHLFGSQLMCAVASIFYKKKIFICTEHNTSNRRRGKLYLKWLDVFIYSRFHSVITCSVSTSKALKCYLGGLKSISTINNGVNLDKVLESAAYSKKQLSFNTTDKIILMAARFSSQKDHATLLRTMLLLPDDVKLLLLGEGETQAEYVNFVKEHDLADRVIFLGHKKDVYSYMKCADIIVQSSHFEGLPLTVVESMALGKPILVSDVVGMNDLVPSPFQIFPLGSDDVLASKINKLLSDPSLYHEVSMACKAAALNYDLRRMVYSYENLYESYLPKLSTTK